MRPPLYLIIAALVLLVVSSCNPGEKKLKIIVTTDVHGSFFPTDINTGEEVPVSLARVQSMLNEERANSRQEIILLDNGDIIQGDPVAYYSNFEKTDEPNICARIMNFMGYNAATVGNHDIEAGHDVYDKLVSDSGFPWLAANAVRTDNGEPYFEAYTIIKKAGLRIAVLGLITPAIPSWLPPDIWSGMEFTDMIESAEYWIKFIQEKEKPDLLIGLFHSGMDYTYNNQSAETPGNENAIKLVAQQVEGFDIIFCGHDHKTWNEWESNPVGKKVLILGSRSKASEVAVAEIKVQKKSRKWVIEDLQGTNLSMEKYQPDSLYMQKFGPWQAEVREYVARPLGTITKSIYSRDAFFGSSAYIDLIHQVQLDISGADISFTAPLSNDSEITAGEIVVGDMFKLYRYENLLYTMELTGKEILGYLNFSYGGWFSTMSSTDDHLILFNKNEEGRLRTSRASYNFDSAMGLIYEVDVRKQAGNMVSITSMANGDPFEPEKIYKVALNSYRGNGGGGHLAEGAGIPHDEIARRLVRSTTKDLRYHMMKWIEEKEIINPEASMQWKVVPAGFAEAGKKQDYPILFRN